MKLRSKLYQVRKDNLSIQEFFAQVKTIVDHLTAVGDKVPEREVIIYILSGLSSYYKSFVTSMNIRFIEPSLLTCRVFL